MSAVERGSRELAERREQDEARDAQALVDCQKRTLSWFRQNFYRHCYMYVPRSYPSYVENPDRPFPAVTDFRLTSDEGHRSSSTFVCEGLRWEVEWEYKGRGGDPADWDDGWWPTFTVVLPTRKLPGRLWGKKVRRSAWTPEQLAAAVEDA